MCLVRKAAIFRPLEPCISSKVCQDCKGLTAFLPEPFLRVALKIRGKVTSFPGQRARLITAYYKSSESLKLRVPKLQCKLTMYIVFIWITGFGSRATDINVLILTLLFVA